MANYVETEEPKCFRTTEVKGEVPISTLAAPALRCQGCISFQLSSCWAAPHNPDVLKTSMASREGELSLFITQEFIVIQWKSLSGQRINSQTQFLTTGGQTMRRGFSGICMSRNLHPILLLLLPGWQRLCRILYPAPTPGEPHAGSLRAEFAPNCCFPFVNVSHLQICSIPHAQRGSLIIWKSRSPRREHFPAPWGSPRSDTCVFNKPARCARLPCLQEGERQWDVYGCSGCSPVNCYKSPSNVKLFFKTWSH